MAAISPSRPHLSRTFSLALLCLAALTFVGATDRPVSLQGTLRLVENGGDETSKEFRSALVWFEPSAPVRLEVPKEPLDMVTVRKEFQPKVMAVPRGATVRFPNQDPILHNVFSISGKNRFDLGLYRGGDAKSTTLEHSGVVRVFCNVHHSMVAYLAVLDTPFYGRIGRDGDFRLDGLPAGPGKLTLWHDRAEPETRDVTLPLAAPLRLDLQLTKEQIPRHRNKFGKPYTRNRRGKAY